MADDIQDVLDAARAQGWRVERTKKGHWMCYAPDGQGKVLLPGTPSDRRAIRNSIAQMRHHGFQWKGR